MTILILSRTRDPHRQGEALRAALGVTLRGGRVEVLVEGALVTPLARRAAETLRAFGHQVDELEAVTAEMLATALARADVVEVWT